MSRLPVPFGNPATYPGHSGVDYAQRRGTTFRASGAGRVTSLGYNSRAAYTIWVQYDDGPLTGYAHMDSHSGCPKVGTRVSEGTPLGFVGNSGRSTGPHLHSEVNGHATTAGYWLYFDPNKVVGQKPAGGGSTPPAQTPVPAPAPTPTNPELEELMSLKSVVIISANAATGNPATMLDFDSGFSSSWSADTTYSANVGRVVAEGGSVIITEGHYNKILVDFAKFFADKKAHELVVAKASSGA